MSLSAFDTRADANFVNFARSELARHMSFLAAFLVVNIANVRLEQSYVATLFPGTPLSGTMQGPPTNAVSTCNRCQFAWPRRMTKAPNPSMVEYTHLERRLAHRSQLQHRAGGQRAGGSEVHSLALVSPKADRGREARPKRVAGVYAGRYYANQAKGWVMALRKSTELRTRAPRFIAVDFFCGAGGTTRGLIDAGGYVIAGIDKDARCAKTYSDNNYNELIDYAAPRFLRKDVFAAEEHYPQGQRDQLFADLDDLIPFYRARSKNAPLLFAICAPCQPFTRLSKKELSGKRKLGRERDSNLLSEASGFVARYRPEMILSENVSSIKDPKYGGVWDEFRKTLEGLGYVTGSKVVCVSRFGVPQYRKRSILVAIPRELVRAERFADIMEQELLVPEADPNATLVSVAQAIGHLPPLGAGEAHPEIPNHRTRTLSDLNLKRISSAKPGEFERVHEGNGTWRPIARLPS